MGHGNWLKHEHGWSMLVQDKYTLLQPYSGSPEEYEKRLNTIGMIVTVRFIVDSNPTHHHKTKVRMDSKDKISTLLKKMRSVIKAKKILSKMKSFDMIYFGMTLPDS